MTPTRADIRRIIGRRREPWVRRRVHCEKCGSKLEYEYGSIMWNCVKRDLCGGCAGREIAARIFAKHFANPEPKP